MRVFVHREQYGRFVSCLVFLPRDRYTTPVRLRVAKRLMEAFGASSYEWNAHLSESVLARLHYVLRVDPTETLDRRVDLGDLERRVALAARTWGDDLHDTLVSAPARRRASTCSVSGTARSRSRTRRNSPRSRRCAT